MVSAMNEVTSWVTDRGGEESFVHKSNRGLYHRMYGCASSPELWAITRASGGPSGADEKRFVAGCCYEYLRVLFRNTPRPGQACLTLNPKSNELFHTYFTMTYQFFIKDLILKRLCVSYVRNELEQRYERGTSKMYRMA